MHRLYLCRRVRSLTLPDRGDTQRANPPEDSQLFSPSTHFPGAHTQSTRAGSHLQTQSQATVKVHTQDHTCKHCHSSYSKYTRWITPVNTVTAHTQSTRAGLHLQTLSQLILKVHTLDHTCKHCHR